MALAAVGGALGGAAEGLIVGLSDGALLASIGWYTTLRALSLSLGAAAAYGHSHWALRGLWGGAVYGLSFGACSVVLRGLPPEWDSVLLGEIIGGLVGGMILAYLWRPSSETAASE
jgi:hypothetical protein